MCSGDNSVEIKVWRGDNRGLKVKKFFCMTTSPEPGFIHVQRRVGFWDRLLFFAANNKYLGIQITSEPRVCLTTRQQRASSAISAELDRQALWTLEGLSSAL